MSIKDSCRQRIACFTLLLGLSSSFIPPTQAAVNDANDDQWHFEITPYIWATGQSGTLGVDRGSGNGQSFDQSFSDIWDRMDIGGMAAFEARYNRWGVLLDGIYLRVSDNAGISGPNGLISLSADGNVTQQQYSVAGYYRTIEGQTTVDALAGLRYNIVSWDINAQLASPVFPGASISRNFSERKGWVDPYAGVRVTHRFDQQWSVVGYADIGGASSGSNLTWQLLGGVNYAFRPDVIGKLGYRYVSINYQNDGFIYDVATSGFYAGVGVTW
ncbi:outer membrane protein [Serratia sp. J2]|uniref:outer membrane protein n=1 Tax=Serratia sp. J2 TaxID=3386551 RepID=UPI0039170A10